MEVGLPPHLPVVTHGRIRARIDPPALLETHHLDTGGGEAPGKRGAGRAGADDEHVDPIFLWRHRRSGHASRQALAASSVVVAASSRRSSMPPSSSRSWATDVALAMGAAMPGRCASQDSATWAGVAPAPAATFSTASRMAKPRSCMYVFCTPPARAVEGSAPSRRYLPERKPLARDEYGITPTPCSRQSGSSSRSYSSRNTRLYFGCSDSYRA